MQRKGHKVELLKDEKVNKQDCYQVKLTYQSKPKCNFLINKNTYLVDRMQAKGAIAADFSGMGPMMSSMGGANRIDKMEATATFSDYKEFDGVKFPTKMTMRLPMGDATCTFSDVKINKPISASLYRAS